MKINIICLFLMIIFGLINLFGYVNAPSTTTRSKPYTKKGRGEKGPPTSPGGWNPSQPPNPPGRVRLLSDSPMFTNLLDDLTDKFNFQNSCLDRTNMYRDRHGVSPLTVDASLVPYCMQRIVDLNNCKFSSDTCGGLNTGQIQQNLYYISPGSSSVPTCEDAIDCWYNEIYHYNWNKPGFSTYTAHFTNMVWKAVTSLACCELCNLINNEAVIVCLYRPPGNSYYQSAYPYNVLPLVNSTVAI